MSLAYAHFVTPYAALALVLGANLGSAINPVFEGAHRDNPASYRLPLGNLVNRMVGILMVTPFLRPVSEWLPADRADVVMDQVPPLAVLEPTAVAPSKTVTVEPASAVPVRVGVSSLVMSSVVLLPVSEAATRSRPFLS